MNHNADVKKYVMGKRLNTHIAIMNLFHHLIA